MRHSAGCYRGKIPVATSSSSCARPGLPGDDRQGPLAAGHVDQTLNAGESTDEVARYVIGIPVRDGLVAAASEYRYTGSDTSGTREIRPGAVHGDQARTADGRSDSPLAGTGS